MLISSHHFAHVEELYDQSLYVRAYHAAQQIAPLEAWEGTAARILAGRLAATVGAPKLGRRQQLLAYRHDPKNWAARYYYARILLRGRGALAAWQFLRQHDNDPSLAAAQPKVHSDWLALHGFVLAHLRDFDQAEAWLLRAEKVAPSNVWVWVERAKVFALQERPEDALAVLRYALILQPWFRPTIQTSAQALVAQGRAEEALRLLTQASQHIECAWIVEQLAHLQIELGQYAEAGQSLERFAALSPRLEPELIEQLKAERAEVSYLRGDYPAAVVFARQCASPAHQKLAAQLQNGVSKEQRLVLPVGFVRQPRQTGTSAILAAISQYYKMPAESWREAAANRENGTSVHDLRKWAQKNGYAAREFRVTWENAQELLKRKIVFTLSTVDPDECQLQLVVGYDSLRRTWLIWDGARQHYSEKEAKALLEHYRACGPRGLALVPALYAQRLNSLPLTEAEQYDHLFAIQEDLENFDRAQAQSHFQAMRQRFGEHRLTLQAQLALATYDDDHTQMLVCYEKLAEQFPEDTTFQLHKARCLHKVAARNQRLTYLRQICSEKKTDSRLWQEYAIALSEDARQWPEAVRWLNRGWRQGVLTAASLHLLATLRGQQQRQAEALELYRFAVCLDDNDERFAQAYFLTAQQLGQTEAALEFMFNRLRGKKSGAGVPILFQSLVQSGKINDAFAALAAGLEKFPSDGRMKLFAAEAQARFGLFEEAASLLQQAQSQAPSQEWQRTAGSLALLRGAGSEALAHWLQVAEAEPLSVHVNQQVAELLAQTDSPQAALEFLRARIARYPHSTRLRALLIEWLLATPTLAEPELQLLLKYDATDEWAVRTLARVLLAQQRFEEALVASETACRINSSCAENHFLRGEILSQLERYAEASEAYRTSLTLSADYTLALTQFVDAATSPQERRESLLFVREEITRQVSSGEALFAYQALAKDTLQAEELLQQLAETLQQRPDLPLVHSVVIAQLIGMHRLDDAHGIARAALARFPLSARLWLDWAQVHELRGECEEYINALQHTVTIDPSFALATQKLAAAYEQQGQLAKARAVIEQALMFSPFNHYHHGQLADIYWKLGEKEKALARIQHVLSLSPDYDWAWRALKSWAEQVQQPHLILQCARDLTRQRPGDARAWLVLARTLKSQEALPEQIAALERAIQLNPQMIEAYILRATLLAEAGQYDEALRACRPNALAPLFPPELLSVEAFVTAQCGDLPGALQKMRMVLKNEPNFAPGWERIARWYRTLEMEAEYLEAAYNLARLMPQYFVAYGYLGEAKLWHGDREGAKESLQRALTLAPDYDFAGLTLFDLQLEDHDLRAAGKTLARLEQFVGSDATTLRALKLALSADNPGQVQKHFLALCQSPVHLTTYLDQAIELLAPTHLDKIIDAVSEDLLATPGVHPHVGTLWARRNAAQPEYCLQRLHQLADQPISKLWHNAAATFLTTCANQGAAEPAHNFIHNYEDALRAEAESWGTVGATLYRLGDAQAAVEWLSDWRKREGVTPGTLWHLALALRDLKREEEAKEVCLSAIKLPEDQCTNSHLALLSLDEALGGHLEDAHKHAARITPHTLNEWDQVMLELATSLREVHTARTEGRSIAQAVIDRLLQRIQQTPELHQSRSFIPLFQRVIENVLTIENDALLKIKTKLKLKWLAYRPQS